MKRLVCLMLGCLAGAAHAHMMEAGQGAVRLVGDSAYAVVALPVKALAGVDDNHDGLLDRDELARHRGSVSAQVNRLMQFTSQGQAGKMIFEDLLLAHASEPGHKGEAHVVVMRRYQWPATVKALGLGLGLFALPASAREELRVRVMDNQRTETAVFNRQRARHTYFAPQSAK